MIKFKISLSLSYTHTHTRLLFFFWENAFLLFEFWCCRYKGPKSIYIYIGSWALVENIEWSEDI